MGSRDQGYCCCCSSAMKASAGEAFETAIYQEADELSGPGHVSASLGFYIASPAPEGLFFVGISLLTVQPTGSNLVGLLPAKRPRSSTPWTYGGHTPRNSTASTRPPRRRQPLFTCGLVDVLLQHRVWSCSFRGKVSAEAEKHIPLGMDAQGNKTTSTHTSRLVIPSLVICATWRGPTSQRPPVVTRQTSLLCIQEGRENSINLSAGAATRRAFARRGGTQERFQTSEEENGDGCHVGPGSSHDPARDEFLFDVLVALRSHCKHHYALFWEQQPPQRLPSSLSLSLPG